MEQIPLWERSIFLASHEHIRNRAIQYGTTLEDIYDYCVENECTGNTTEQSKELRHDADNRRIDKKPRSGNN